MIDTDAIRRAWECHRTGAHWHECHLKHERCAILRLCDEVDELRSKLHAAKVRVNTIQELERRRCGDLARHYGVSGFLIRAIEAGFPHPFSCMPVDVPRGPAQTVCSTVEGVQV